MFYVGLFVELEEAPTKLQVSVRVDDVDWKKIQDMFDKQHEWMTTQMQKHIREVNQMFYEERKRVQERYKEYDGTYLGHYVQYIFWFFFTIGLFMFGLGIFMLLVSRYVTTGYDNIRFTINQINIRTMGSTT